MCLLDLAITVSYGKAPVLRDLRLQLREGEILGLVGHSGCGKTSLALAVLGLLPLKDGTVSGSICWKGRELLNLHEREWSKLRGKEIAFIPQSPVASLNPALRLRKQLAEAWKLHASGSRHQMQDAILCALANVGLPSSDEFLKRYPSQISVGQAQRVLIAMAILHSPSLLIADEATSALDAITQAEILALLSDLNRKFGMSVLFISHNLLSLYSLCRRIALIHDGSVVECETAQDIFFSPSHPFTRKLVAALPSIPTIEEPAFHL